MRRTATPPGAHQADAAGLTGAQRRTGLVRAGIWTLLLCGPAALVIGTVAPQARPTPAPPAAQAAETARPQGPSGFAELFLTAWLHSRADADTPASRILRTLAPQVALPQTRGGHAVDHTAVLEATPIGPGYWSITVAAQVRPLDATGGPAGEPQLRFFTLPVVATGTPAHGGASAEQPVGYTVVTTPAEVAAPARASGPTPAYPIPVPAATPLYETLAQFLGAYLSGVGQVERYLAPGLRLSPVATLPYRQVRLDQVSAAGELPALMPAEGTRVRVLVRATARDSADGQWPLTYALSAATRSGRWEITALEAAPLLAGVARAEPAPLAPSPPLPASPSPAAATPRPTASPTVPPRPRP